MPRIDRPSGLRLDFPSHLEPLASEPTEAPRRGGLRGGGRRFTAKPIPPAEEAGDDALIGALAPHGLEVAAQEDLAPVRAAGTRRGGTTAGDITLAYPVASGEDAVVLTEQDGVYAWSFPDAGVAAGEGRTRGTRTPSRERSFRVALPEGPAESQQPRTRGFIGDAVLGRVRMYVLKFAARAVTGRVVDHLERNVKAGPVHITEADPSKWLSATMGAAFDLPRDRPARLLLLVHGTFSSTAGAYGALGAFPWGQALLERAKTAYDAVLGFDHRTLGQDPKTNAEDLLAFLRALDLAHPPRIDVVTHSRGGLVYRSLAELVLPGVAESLRPRFGSVVFTGVPNAGTTLADPDRWRDFIDLYTNIAVGACRVIGKLPQAHLVAKILSEAIQGMSGLVKALAEQALESGDVPGLAAMRPGGDFIRLLNRRQAGQPRPDTTFYCAVTSEFTAYTKDPHEPPELPRRLLMGLVDRVADRVLGEANDLVVNTASMTAIDGGGAFIKDHLHFERTPHIYHTNYFGRPEVVDALGRWLDLERPAIAVEAAPTAGSRMRLPANVNTNVVVATSDTTVDELRDLTADGPDFVIVRRPWEGRVLSYAYWRRDAELQIADRDVDETLLDALNMHEWQASAEVGVAEVQAAPAGGSGATSHVVVVEAGKPVGVLVPADTALPGTDAVVEQALRGRRQAGPIAPPGFVGTVDAPPSPAPAPRVKRGGRTRGASRGGAGRGVLGGQQQQQQQQQQGTARRTRRTRGGSRSAPSPAEAAAARALCHFQAEMDDAVAVDTTATLAVMISRDAIAPAAGRATATSSGSAALDRPLVLDIRPRKNFEVQGPSRVEVPVPGPGELVERFFDVRATDAGPGEVWVTVRQGPEQIALLRLSVVVTEAPPSARGAARAETSARESKPDAQPLRQLRIFERDNGTQISHEYELQIPGVVFETYRSAPMTAERREYVDAIYREIENRWLTSDEDVDEFVEELRAMGADLFGQLFPHELQRVLWQHRQHIQSIQVISTEPFIPWELVHLKEPGGPLPDESLFLAELGLVRWLHGSWNPERIRVRPGRARYVVPDYPHPDDKLPEAQEEIGYLEDAFGAEAVEPQPKAVRKVLRGPGAVDLLHFACHGEVDSNDVAHAALMLEGRVEHGSAVPASITVTTVAEHSRLADAEGNRPLVVLNACEVGRLGFRLTKVGGFADAFLRGGAGAFVGSLWKVGDGAARKFTEALYAALTDGKPLAEAAAAARTAARVDGDATWLAYAVYGHPALRLELE